MGEIDGLKDGTHVYVVPNTLETWRDSAIVKDCKFHFTIPLPHAASFSIRVSKDYEVGKWMDFYADKGTINLTGKKGSFVDVQFSGSPYSIQYNNYLTFLRKQGIDKKLNQIFLESEKAEKQKDTVRSDSLFKAYSTQYAQKIELTKIWIKAHPHSPISTYLLYTEVKNETNTEELEKMLNRLAPQAKANYFGETLQEQINAEMAGTIGKIARDFTQNDTSGTPVSLHDFRGKYVLLDFWASWCAPCREENPELVKMYHQFKNKGFTILSVSLDNNREAWVNAIQQDGLVWPQVADLKFWDNEAARKYYIHSLPSNYLLDPNGKIIAKHLHGNELEQVLAEYLK